MKSAVARGNLYAIDRERQAADRHTGEVEKVLSDEKEQRDGNLLISI